MKKQLILLFLLFSAWIAKGQTDYWKYPYYNQVVINFFSKYTLGSSYDTALLRFEKRASGWHVTLINYSNQTIKDELFWSKKKNQFIKIEFDKLLNKDENKEGLETFLQDDEKKYYNISPYYGYSGWDWDVIQKLKDSENLPDSILYALARAYSSFASNLLHNNSGLADSKQQFKLPEGKNCLQIEQLEKYRHYRHQAIKTFKKLQELNPEYETIVGKIDMKYFNEHVTSFLDLRIYQNEEEANKELGDGLYTDFYIATAKNYLNSCAPNAILFTNGDNDTYPLLYVQAKHGFRTDVMVVNTSLLRTDRYINSLREGVLDAPGFPISLNPEKISGRKGEFVIIETNEDAEVMELQDLITFAIDERNSKSYGNVNYYNMPTNKFRLSHDEGSIEWKVDRYYFLRNELVALDLLATNKWKRPIYFAISLAPESYLGLGDYLQLEGLAYRLMQKKKSADNEFGFVNSDVIYSNLMTKFDWSGLNRMFSHEKLLSQNYRFIFHSLANSLFEENKIDSVKLILAKCEELLPNEILAYDDNILYLIEIYYKVKEHEKANKMAEILIYNWNNNINIYSDITNSTESTHDASRKKLKEIALKYNQQDVLMLLER